MPKGRAAGTQAAGGRYPGGSGELGVHSPIVCTRHGSPSRSADHCVRISPERWNPAEIGPVSAVQRLFRWCGKGYHTSWKNAWQRFFSVLA